LSSGVTIVGIDVTRPTSVVDSSGLAGEVQRARLLEVLTDASLKSRFVILALHYGLLTGQGTRDRRNHGLVDDLEVMALIDREDVTLDLVLHGHMHRPYVMKTAKRQIINAGSATDLHLKQPGYHVYELDPSAHTVRIERREWSPERATYLAVGDSPLSQTLVTR
jgi:3',5'-cyclic AMP phosphodiesterase CpdA